MADFKNDSPLIISKGQKMLESNLYLVFISSNELQNYPKEGIGQN